MRGCLASALGLVLWGGGPFVPCAAESSPGGVVTQVHFGASAPGAVSRPLAVLVPGQLSRHYPRSIFRHVVAPAVRDGFDVDYFTVLTTGADAAGRRPWKSHNVLPFAVPNPEIADLSAPVIQQLLAELAAASGARSLVLALAQQDMPVDEKLDDPAWVRWMGRARGDEQHLRRLRRFRQIESLWNLTLTLHGGNVYDRVVLLSEDVYWLGDLRAAQFSGRRTVHARRHGGLCMESFRAPGAIDDRFFIMDGRAAEAFLRPYSAFFHHQSEALDGAANVEEFFERLTLSQGLRLQVLPKSTVPYAVALHLDYSKWAVPRFCLRYFGSSTEPAIDCIDRSRVPEDICEDYHDHMIENHMMEQFERHAEYFESYGRNLWDDLVKLGEDDGWL